MEKETYNIDDILSEVKKRKQEREESAPSFEIKTKNGELPAEKRIMMKNLQIVKLSKLKSKRFLTICMYAVKAELPTAILKRKRRE